MSAPATFNARLRGAARSVVQGLALALLLGAGPAPAQQPQALEAAVLQLAQSSAMQAPLAPLPHTALRAGSSCSWCSSSFLGICLKHDDENWGQTLDMDWQTPLDHAQTQSNAIGARVAASAGAARTWMANLPAFSARFDSAADVVLGVQAEIGSAAPTPDQRARATGALQELADMVSSSTAQLEDASRALAGALQEQSGYRDEIARALADSLRASGEALEAFENGAHTHRCQDGVAGQLAAARASVGASQEGVRARVAYLSSQSSAIEQSLGVLLGAMLNARGDLDNVLRLVQAARNDQVGSFLAQLHLSAAKRQWQDLAAAQSRALPAIASQ